MSDKGIQVKIRSCQVIKTHTNRFCFFTGKYKDIGLNGQTSQARSVHLRPRALYFPAQNKTGLYAHSINQGSNSVMQADWLKTFECDVMIGHYYPVMLAHYDTTQL